MKKTNGQLNCALRFHVDLSHGELSADAAKQQRKEDIRRLMRCLDLLDEFQIPAAWSFEEETLSRLLPEEFPTEWQRISDRVKSGDEADLFVGAFLPALNEEEGTLAFRSAAELLSARFGTGQGEILRTDKFVYSCTQNAVCKKFGVRAVSLLTGKDPLAVTSVTSPDWSDRYRSFFYDDGVNGKTTVLPCITLRGLGHPQYVLHKFARYSAKAEQKKDLLIFFDVETADAFSGGFGRVGKILLEKTLKILQKNEVRFLLPKDYEPFGTDRTETGNTDVVPRRGFGCFAERKENLELWSHVERTRRNLALADYLNNLLVDRLDFADKRSDALRRMVAAMSVNALFGEVYGGVAYQKAFHEATESERISAEMLAVAEERTIRDEKTFMVVPSRSMERETCSLPVEFSVAKPFGGVEDAMHTLYTSYFTEESEQTKFHLLLKDFASQKKFRLTETTPKKEKPNLLCSANSIENEFIRVVADIKNDRIYFQNISNNRTVAYLRSRILWGRETCEMDITDITNQTEGAEIRMTVYANIMLNEHNVAQFRYEFRLIETLPYLWLETHCVLPQTKAEWFRRKRKINGKPFDCRWKEFCPTEILPQFSTTEKTTDLFVESWGNAPKRTVLRYGKQAFGAVGGNVSVAFSDKLQGLLVAEDTSYLASSAFCGMKTVKSGENVRILLNPFGAYRAEKRCKWMRRGETAKQMYCSQAPSFNGATLSYRLMLAPFSGPYPPQSCLNDALQFAYAPYVVKGKEI